MPGGGIPWDDARQDDVQLSRSGRVVWLLAALLFAGLLWAWMAELDEVATSQGTVVPTSREQVIQSLEGGILARLMVREDEVVEPGQILAELDPAEPFPVSELGTPRGRQGSPRRVVLPEGWLDETDGSACAVQEEMHSGG